MDTEKEFKEFKERLDKIEKEITDIKTNYLLTKEFEEMWHKISLKTVEKDLQELRKIKFSHS